MIFAFSFLVARDDDDPKQPRKEDQKNLLLVPTTKKRSLETPLLFFPLGGVFVGWDNNTHKKTKK